MGWDGPMTHRQYITWQEWLEQQWHTPSKLDWALASIACETHRAALTAEGRSTVHNKDFLVKFVAKDAEQKSSDPRPAYVPLNKDGQPYLKQMTAAEAVQAQQAYDRARIEGAIPRQRAVAEEQIKRMEARRARDQQTREERRKEQLDANQQRQTVREQGRRQR